MAVKSSLQCLWSSLAAVLLLLALLLFAVTLAIGIAGIVIATQDNVCQSDERVGRGCIPVENEDLAADVNLSLTGSMRLPEVVDDLNTGEDYLYWLIGATGSGLVFCVAGSFCVWASTRVLYWIYKQEGKDEEYELGLIEIDGEDAMEDPINEIANEPMAEEYLSYNKMLRMQIEGIDTKRRDSQKWKEYKEGSDKMAISIEDGLYELVKEYDEGLHLKKLSIGALIGLCFSFLFGIVSILCLLWSFALGFNRSRRFEQTVTPFVVANILSGITAPMLFFISAFITVNIVDYFTSHKIEAHLILTWFLPCLKFEEGVDCNGKRCRQWVLANSLVLRIQKEESSHCIFPTKIYNSYFSFTKMCLPNYSTILLSIIVVLSLSISFSYFIDITLVSQVTVASCSDPTINIQYSCFRAGTLSPVNCMSSNGTQRLHCFRFYRFGVDVDLITSIASAFAFYLFTNRIFNAILFIVRTMRNFTIRQGEIFIFGGLLLLLMTGSIGVVWIFGYSSESVILIAHLDVLNIGQLAMVSLFIMIIGLLARHGEWMEKRPAKHKNVKFEKETHEEQQVAINIAV